MDTTCPDQPNSPHSAALLPQFAIYTTAYGFYPTLLISGGREGIKEANNERRWEKSARNLEAKPPRRRLSLAAKNQFSSR
ncbi:Hypothetical predicted protein [Podarcis lilfordi]|uniref:Uncharacterized protein n=1 Tax=Podarcis lilfordi TaxID=74358 RepID=A0AA35P9W3_9SAUR|nr:Hypothetical predicted protein [Podarcis lilfordi]